MSKRPYELIRIYLDRCSLTFGESPCQAVLTGENKCFNTLSTCQSAADYSPAEHEYIYVSEQSDVPQDIGYAIPNLQRVSIKSPEINPQGGDKSAKAFGVRGTLTATFRDHPDTDRAYDPYLSERTYDPMQKGTHWTKLRARNPYYHGRRIVYESGFLDGLGVRTETKQRTYFITGMNTVDASGSLSIQAKDPITFALGERNKAPFESKGKLIADINETVGSFSIDDNEEDYPSSGFIAIGSEVMSFTRSGATFAVSREQRNTAASSHDADSVVQLCLEYNSDAPADILYDLLKNYALFPDEWLDTAQWAAEQTDNMTRLYSRLITEPTGIDELIGQMMMEMYFYAWWDDVDAKIKMRAVRPIDNEEVKEIDEERNIVAGSLRLTDDSDIYSTVAVYHGQIDPTGNGDEKSNYAGLQIVTDPSSGSEQEFGKIARTKTVFARWITVGGGAAAQDLAARYVARYGRLRKVASFKLDEKDRVEVGDFLRMTSRLHTNAIGDEVPLQLQVLGAAQVERGASIDVKASEFSFIAPPVSRERQLIVSTDMVNVNMRDWHDSEYGTPTSGDVVRLIVLPGSSISNTLITRPAGDFVDANARFSSLRSALRRYEFDFDVFGNVASAPYLARRGVTGTDRYDADSSNIASADQYSGEYVINSFREVAPRVALDSGNWPEGVELIIEIKPGGYISGLGGNGAYAFTDNGILANNSSTYVWDNGSTVPGGDGSDAMIIRHPVKIINQGVIQHGWGGRGAMRFSKYTGTNPKYTWDAQTAGGGGRGGTISGTGVNPTNGTQYSNVLSWGGANYNILRWQNTALDVDQQPDRISGRGSIDNMGANARQANRWGLEWPSRGPSFSGFFVSDFIRGEILRLENQQSFGDDTFTYDTNSSGANGKACRAGASLITWQETGTVTGDLDD